MTVWITTDTHFNHKKMIDYCGRPENHTEIIGRNLLSASLKESDVVVHLGDVCIGADELMHDLYIRPLRCKKWLVLGNHDRKSQGWYLSHGWDWVGYQFSSTYFGKKILFSHMPLPEWGINSFDLNIHGHFHNSNHHIDDPEWIQSPKHKLLAIENSRYRPVSLESILKETLC